MKRVPHSFHRQGAALTIVLFLLILLTVMTVGFFAASSLETRSTSANQTLGSLNRLSELPLEIVKAQIYAATTTGQTGALDSLTHGWASQPGLIRVFDVDGSLARAYKLYSSSRMEETDTAFIGSSIPDTWNDQPNRYVNLNQPYPSISNGNQLVYPIVNPAASDWAEGLAINADPAGLGDATMPVEWLYATEDGTIVTQDKLTAANPPIGRIAFWTDDESCKININTAGERTMWDRPRAWHQKREQYGKNQPATGEYNAYPGHPATVSLSAAFEKVLTGKTSDEIVEAMLSLSPRYRWGGSENGALALWDDRTDLDRSKDPANNKNDRLYSTSCELAFTAAGRTLIDSALEDPVLQSGFLLTESSRAPELNLFGLPRIGIWPVDTNTSKQTVYDKLIARCSTIGATGGKAYYFQRADPLASDEATSITRNWELLGYLDKLTSRKVIGFGGSFDDKWGTSERRQILTEIFDYIRGGVNLSDTSRPLAEFNKQFTPANQALRGYVVPTKIAAWNTKGAGRAPALTNVGIILYAYDFKAKGTGDPAEPDDKTDVHLLLWLNFCSPMHGTAPYSTTYKMVLKQYHFGIKEPDQENFSSFTMKGTTSDRLFFPRNNQTADWGGYDGMVLHGGSTMGGLAPYEFHSGVPVSIRGNAMDFSGGRLEVEVYDNATDQLLTTYEMDFPDSTTPWPVPLPWQRADIGTVAPWFFYQRAYNTKIDADQVDPEKIQAQRNTLIGYRRSQSQVCDVIRSVELKDGDARIVACLDKVDASFYQPSYGYFDSSRRIAASLMFREYGLIYGNEVGTFLDASFATLQETLLPVEVGGKRLKSFRGTSWAGDLDNGFLGVADGPYMNKPDEGYGLDKGTGTTSNLPYLDIYSSTVNGIRMTSWNPQVNGFFSPTRQIASAVMFGSLPVGVKRTSEAYTAGDDAKARPWQTLLFSPNSQAAMVADADGVKGHPGELKPHDHLLLDLFTMPVVEPYAISEPFSTAGKINLNQRLIPFTHIDRKTGLVALLKNLEFLAIPHADPNPAKYRKGSAASTIPMQKVDVDATLAGMEAILDPGGIRGSGAFRSASEICNLFLIPQGLGSKPVQQFWEESQLTGDNTREAPYNYLYPLLTTQSNTYQVHYWVQSLKPLRKKAGYDPSKDFIIDGEQRGSYLIERYLNADDPRLSGEDAEIDTDAASLNPFYQFRVLRSRLFAPGS